MQIHDHKKLIAILYKNVNILKQAFLESNYDKQQFYTQQIQNTKKINFGNINSRIQVSQG